MPEATAPNPQSDAVQLEVAADQAIAACGGDAREALKALLVANEFLEAELVSHGYMRVGDTEDREHIPASKGAVFVW